MPTTGVVARLMVELNATGVAKSGEQIRQVGTESEHTTAKMGLMKRFMGSFLGQQLIFSVISKAIGLITTNIQDIGTKTNEWDSQLAQLNAVMKSTGDVSGVTSQSVIDLANSLSKVSLYNNATIMSGENMLLTFTAIGKNVFPLATQAITDMAAKFVALHKDMNISDIAIQVGKALNDPIKGYTALKRVGVTLTQAQDDLIKKFMKTNDIAGAQTVILQELEREFGGAAAAGTTTFAGRLQVLNNQLDVAKEAIGNAVIPALSGLFATMAPGIAQMGTALPNALKTAGNFFKNYLAVPLGDVKDIIGDVFGALGTLIGGFVSTSGKGATLRDVSHGVHDALQATGAVIKILTPPLKTVGQLFGNAATNVVALTRFLTQHKEIVIGVAATFATIMAPALWLIATAFVGAKIAAIQAGIAFAIANAPLLLIAAGVGLVVAGVVLLITHWKQMSKVAQDVWKKFNDFHLAIVILLGPIAWLVAGVILVVQHFHQITAAIGNALGWLGQFKLALLVVVAPIALLVAGAILLVTHFKQVAGFIGNFVGGAMKNFGDSWNGLLTIVTNVGKGIGSAVRGGINDAINLINLFISALDSIQIHIPSVGVGPVHSPAFDWGGMGIPKIPLLGEGGTVTRAGRVVVGDPFAPEVIDLPAGARVSPLTHGPTRDLTKPAARSGGDMHLHIHAANTTLTAQEAMRLMRKEVMLNRAALA